MKVSVCIPCYNEEELVVKCLDSVPERDDIEIVIIEDCSTDSTYQVLQQYVKDHPNKIINLLHNEENMGHGYTINKCIDNATGDWIVELGSDDYFIQDKVLNFIDTELDYNYDLVFFGLVDNNGRVYLNNKSRLKWSGAVKFIKREWLGDLRGPADRYGNDIGLFRKIVNRQPKMKFTTEVLTHWNFPNKVGTLSWRYLHHEIDIVGNEIKRGE